MTATTLAPKQAVTLLRATGHAIIKRDGLYQADAAGWMTESEFLAFAERELASKTPDATAVATESPPHSIPEPPGGWGYHSLKITQIRRDGGTQARVGLNEETVQEYAELMREQRWDWNSLHRPIVLYDGADYWLADGFHRIESAQRAEMTTYPVEVLRGGKRDAVLRACGANAQHGLKRSNADKRRAVEILLKDTEWQLWSDRKIAEVCDVGNKFVGDVRRELSVFGTQIPQTRTVERNGTTYQMTPARGAINTPDGAPAEPTSMRPMRPADIAPPGLPARWFITSRTDNKITWYQAVGPYNQVTGEYTTADEAAEAARALAANVVGQRADPNQADPKEPPPAAPELPSPTPIISIPSDIAKRAAQLELLIDGQVNGLILYWPEEAERLDLFAPQSITDVRVWLRDEAPRRALQRLDRQIPKELSEVGYFWYSADPPQIAHSDGWRGDAPTAVRALDLARDRIKAGAATPARVRSYDVNEVARLSYQLGAMSDRAQAWDVWQRIGHALVSHDAHSFAVNLLRILADVLADEGDAAQRWIEAGESLLDIAAAAAPDMAMAAGIAQTDDIDEGRKPHEH